MPDIEQIIQQIQAILAPLPDSQQRQVINRLAVLRYERRWMERATRGTANDPAEPAIDGAATLPDPPIAAGAIADLATYPARWGLLGSPAVPRDPR